MATTHELAATVNEIRQEMARRIDELQSERHMDRHAAAGMEGILEWLRSVEEAVRACDGIPSDGHPRAGAMANPHWKDQADEEYFLFDFGTERVKDTGLFEYDPQANEARRPVFLERDGDSEKVTFVVRFTPDGFVSESYVSEWA